RGGGHRLGAYPVVGARRGWRAAVGHPVGQRPLPGPRRRLGAGHRGRAGPDRLRGPGILTPTLRPRRRSGLLVVRTRGSGCRRELRAGELPAPRSLDLVALGLRSGSAGACWSFVPAARVAGSISGPADDLVPRSLDL